MKKSKMEHKYTSTGIKFWRHRKQMEVYRDGFGDTVISTHISPEGSCNLSCSYCSVSKRDKYERIELDVIKDYITKLKSYNLQACIITGGGEPVLYPYFNELVTWLVDDMKLKVALITNGTVSHKVNVWNKFSWIRVSINNFKDWQRRIYIPTYLLSKECVLGASLIYAGKNIEILKDTSILADILDLKYIRLLPDCMYTQDELLKWHSILTEDMKQLSDDRFFHQYKIHGTPISEVCHQAYFRPYLSEVAGGTVFPCDSLVLNNQAYLFSDKFAICKAKDILNFMDNKIKINFDPRKLCTGCVFTDNIELLHNWKTKGINKFDEYVEPLNHEEFV